MSQCATRRNSYRNPGAKRQLCEQKWPGGPSAIRFANHGGRITIGAGIAC